MMTQELDLEDPLEIVKCLGADDGAALIATLTDDEAQTLVDRLKAGADKYWAINPNRSLEMADTIIKLADGRDNLSHKALGMMARGDALMLLGDAETSWNALEEAGEYFLQASNEVGWARTRIGRLALCTRLNRVLIALKDSERAREIINDANLNDFLLRLDFNTGYVYYFLGEPHHALHWYHSALSIAKKENESTKRFLGVIFLNMGAVHCDLLGNYNKAEEYYKYALDFALARHENKNIALAKHDMAYVAMGRGQYSHALILLYEAIQLYEKEGLSFDANYVNRMILECYLALNRYYEAKEIAVQVLQRFRSYGAAHDVAYTLLHVATAEAGLNHFESAEEALNSAESQFASLGANTWVALTQLRRGQLAFKQNNMGVVRTLAHASVAYFEKTDQRIHYATSILLLAQTYFADKNLMAANNTAKLVLKIAKQANIPLLRYGAQLLLGHIAEAQVNIPLAIRSYVAANAAIERIQQGLTITLRPNFLEDKNEALHSLIEIYLSIGNINEALEALERTKSQVFLDYLTHRQLLRWSDDDPKCKALMQELDQLRGEHHWWYQKVHGGIATGKLTPSIDISTDVALKEVAVRERRMRTITEQLYLQNNASSVLLPAAAPRLQDIQQNLNEETLLIEFYYDSKNVWIFTIDATTCVAQQLSTSITKIEHNLNLLHFNIDTTLYVDADTSQMSGMKKQVQMILQHLYDQLLTPIASRLQKFKRLIFVPYGSLHYLPFHLLFTGSTYIIEHHEVVVLPAAGYVTHHGPKRIRGARVIAHSLNGALPQAIDEAQSVHVLFGGTIYIEGAASRSALQAAPYQILHIATHAEYRQQQPDLSYIELADGHLLTDDLLQQDMSYELVTLSACETGRSHAASSDELIGLGRGFLYAGAGALVASQWRVVDDITTRLMKHFYQELHAGVSKAAALRTAQLAILKEEPQIHPAFWGAFQLMGDPRPLSSNSSAKNTR